MRTPPKYRNKKVYKFVLMTMANNPYARNIQHNSDAFWESTDLPLFNRVMIGSGYTFDSIGIDDLLGDNSIVVMSDFANSCKYIPPLCKQPQ